MGQTVALSVQLMSTTGFNQLAPLSVSGLPAGVTASFKPSSITAGQTSVLTLSASANQPISTASLSITAAATVSGIPLTQTATAALSVQAPTTTFLGRAVVADSAETPLAGVTVTMLGLNGGGSTTGCTGATVSDAAGNFALTSLSASCVGPQLVGFNGNTVTSPAGKYAGVNLIYTLVSGQVTASPVLVHLPMITGAETFNVQQNAATDQTYSFKSIPGLTVTVYAHTTFTQEDGTKPNPFPLVAIDVPVDRLPEQMPTSNSMVMGFIVAFQPANVVASQPVAVSYPNTLNAAPGASLPLMTLDPTRGRMVAYGTASASADGTQIIPNIDPSTGSAQHHFGIVNFDWHGWASPPPNQSNPSPNNCDPTIMSCIPPAPPPCTCGGSNPSGTAQSQGSGPSGGDPVDLSSGLFYKTAVDLAISGNRGSISIQRIYRNGSTNEGPFGPGSQMQYGWYLNTASANTAAAINLIAPDGNQFVFSRQTNNTLTNSSQVSLQGITMTTNAGNVATLRLRNGTVWQFQPSGSLSYLSAITDRNGNTTDITQAGVGPGLLRITQITDPVARSIRMTYDSNGHMTSAVDPIGRTVAYTYNPSGTLASFTDANGGVEQYQYDSQNRIVSETDARGVVLFQNKYDANGRIVSQIQPDGGIVSFAYTLVTPMVPTSPVQLTIATDALGNRISYRFNPQGYLTDVIDAVGQTKNFLRAPGTNLLLQITGTAQCSVCGPPGQGSVSYTYDSLGNALTAADALGNTTTYTYDPIFSQVTSITDELGNQSKFSYDSVGNLTASTDANSHATTFTYDSTGLPLTVTDPLGNVSKVSYSFNGDPFYFTDALGNVTSYGFDEISRMTTVADALGKKTMYTFDALDRLLSVKDGRGSTTQFSWDPLGNLLSLIDPRGNATTFTYDDFSRLKTRVSALGKSESRQYDFNGNQTQFTDRRGQVSQFQYDALNRPVKETYQDGAVVTRAYDPYSRLLAVSDSVGGLFTFGYDLNGSLVSQGEPAGTVNYTRDQLHRVSTRQVAGQAAVTYTYDPAGNMLGASLPTAGISYSYDARDLPTTVLRTNGVASTYTFDPLGRVLSLTHSKGTTAINTQTYTYDQSGNRDSATNDISQPLITQATAATVDVADELLTNGLTTYTNDANGNRLTETTSVGRVTYQWDSRNRLSSIMDASGDVTSFKYDFSRNLLEIDKTATGFPATQKLVIDSLTNVASLTDSSGLPASVLTGRSVDSHYASVDVSGNLAFGIGDPLNSTAGVTNSAGATASKLDYEPYGQAAGAATASYPFTFTGRVPITATLLYLRNRYYDVVVNRFISEDPIGPLADEPNLFRYAGGNPTSGSDPLGLMTDQQRDLLNALVNGAKAGDEAKKAVKDAMTGWRDMRWGGKLMKVNWWPARAAGVCLAAYGANKVKNAFDEAGKVGNDIANAANAIHDSLSSGPIYSDFGDPIFPFGPGPG